MTNQNFIGVKMGDVNGSATGNANEANTESRNSVALTTENELIPANVPHTLVLDADVDAVVGVQFTMTLNNADLVEMWIGGKKLSDANIARINENTYTVSWNDVNAANGKALITLNVIAKEEKAAASVVAINSNITAAELYAGEQLQTSKLSLRFAGEEKADAFTVFQNEPNPFTDKTTIGFALPEAGNATLKVFDVNGKVIYTSTGSYGKGMNSFVLSKAELPTTGVMMYQVESGTNTITKKMIGLE
jgi:hypothetical protein